MRASTLLHPVSDNPIRVMAFFRAQTLVTESVIQFHQRCERNIESFGDSAGNSLHTCLADGHSHQDVSLHISKIPSTWFIYRLLVFAARDSINLEIDKVCQSIDL